MTGVGSAARRLLGVAASVAVLVGFGALPASAATPEWHIERIGAPMGAAGITVAVVDSGVDANHPALAGRVLPQIDLVTEEPSKGDPNGHGTHVAGTVGAHDIGCGGGEVRLGVAGDVRILPVRVLDSKGTGNSGTVAKGIRAAADAGAHVINLSLGSDVVIRAVVGSGLEEAIDYAWSKGSIPVLAAGNDGVRGALLGSGYGGIPAIVVTATTHEDRVAPYATSIGSAEWGISAPGGDGSGERGRDVLSALPDSQCGLKAGTSMAAPHVSGSLAVLRSKGLGQRASVDRLLETARPLGSSNTYGAGLVDLAAATSEPDTAPAPTPAPEPTTTTTTTAGPTATAAPSPEEPAGTTSPPTTAADQSAATSSTTVVEDDADDPEPTVTDDGGSTSTTGTAVRPDGADGADTTEDAAGTGRDLVVTDEDEGGTPAGVVAVAGVAIAVTGAVTAKFFLAGRRP